MKDWRTAETTGQDVAQTIPRLHAGGADQAATNFIFAYSLAANSTKTITSLLFPANSDMHVLAITLVPYLGPTPPPSVPFSTGFESGDTQPTWLDTIESSSNVTGFDSNSNPECSPGNETVHSGASALVYSGTANGGIPCVSTNVYFKVFQVSIPVTNSTVLDFWIYPQEDDGRFVGVDLHCADGMLLRDSGAVDQNGHSLHPYFGHGGNIPVDAWTEIRSDIGLWLAGKTIDRISVAYDRNNGSGPFRGYIDDIRISP